MGSNLQKGLAAIGVPQNTIKYFFQSTQDKIVNAIITGDRDQLDLLYQTSNYTFGILIAGENGLMLAVRMNQITIVKYIIDSMSDTKIQPLLEEKNQYGDTPLMIATINQNIEIVQILIGVGAKVNSREINGANIFMAGCASGNLELVAYLYGIPGINLYQKNMKGQTAMHRACFYGEIEIVRFLMKNTKLSLLTKDRMGNNCFHLAAQHLNITLIRYMLKKSKKNTSILQLENGENKSTLSILQELFNTIKEESFPEIEEGHIFEYLKNKDLPPEVNMWTRKHREIQKKLAQPHLANQRKRKTLIYRLNLK